MSSNHTFSRNRASIESIVQLTFPTEFWIELYLVYLDQSETFLEMKIVDNKLQNRLTFEAE